MIVRPGKFLAAVLVCFVAGSAAMAQQAPAPAKPYTPGMPDLDLPPNPSVPQLSLGPGLTPGGDYRQFEGYIPPPKAPESFTSIFNGHDLSGWHISKTARHGNTPDFHVLHGVIVGTQQPYGSGGLLITDKRYRNFEFYMEAKGDWGADSGVFFRTTEAGAAYQVTLDYLPGGSMGQTIQEGGLVGVGRPVGQENTRPAPRPANSGPPAPDPGMSAWKHDDWNSVRIRVEGEAPHVTVWINGKQVSDFTDTANHAPAGPGGGPGSTSSAMVEGPIAIQIHGGDARWTQGAFWRWRNLAIRELPAK